MDTQWFLKSVNVLRLMVLPVVAGLMTGCASQAQPNLINGQYFMAGDNDCKYVKPWSDTVITCFNSAGVATGFRNAITEQQVNYHYAQQNQQQVQMQQLNQQLQQFNQQTQQQTQALQQAPQYVAPQVAPLNQPGDNQIRCINTGIVTNCRY
jgi:hypothetical protein